MPKRTMKAANHTRGPILKSTGRFCPEAEAYIREAGVKRSLVRLVMADLPARVSVYDAVTVIELAEECDIPIVCAMKQLF